VADGPSVSIRPATDDDLPTVVAVHLDSFPDAFLSHLGDRFLTAYYRLVLERASGVLLVASLPDGRVIAFASGDLAPAGLYRDMARRWPVFGRHAFSALVRRRARPFRVLVGLRHVLATGTQPWRRGDDAELTSLAVAPVFRGEGVGRAVAVAFCEAAAGRGSRRVVLDTDTDANGGAGRMFATIGFSEIGALWRGRPMLLFARPLEDPAPGAGATAVTR
jgi:ribosomal protein S18 acetylase RimI-like enzyme